MEETVEQNSLEQEITEFINRFPKKLNEWRKAPPHRLGWLLLGLVATELTVAQRLVHNQGLDISIFHQIMGSVIFILSCEIAFLLIAGRVGALFNKKGPLLKTLSLFNLSLAPLLFFLPITVLLWAMKGSTLLRLAVLAILGLKILSDWKDIIKTAYKLNPLQSYVLTGVVMTIIYIGLNMILLLTGFGVLAEALSALGLG